MRTDHSHAGDGRTEDDLRQAMTALADTARTPAAVQTRIAARSRRRAAPRVAGFLVVAATLVVAAAVAVPLMLGRGGGGGNSATSAAGAPEGAPLAWTFSHAFDLPADWRIRIRRITATSEVTILATPAVGPMTRQCRFTVYRMGARTPPSGPTVDVNGRPGTADAADGMVTVHWMLADGAQASLSCADTESALLLARAVNDQPQTVTLPYRFTAFPDGYRPASLAVEYADDQTTSTVTLSSASGSPDLTVTASSLRLGGDRTGTPTTVNGREAVQTDEGIVFDANGQGMTIRLDSRLRTTAQTRDRLLLDTAEALDIANGSHDADTALNP